MLVQLASEERQVHWVRVEMWVSWVRVGMRVHWVPVVLEEMNEGTRAALVPLGLMDQKGNTAGLVHKDQRVNAAGLGRKGQRENVAGLVPKA